MSFIEGVGDEVTAFFVILIVIVLATLVTFIGNGSHLYSITPTHTRTLPAQPELTPQQAPERQIPNTEPPENNRTTPPYPTTNTQWPRTDNRYYREVLSRETPVEEVSDDTEDQSSSDDARPSEVYPEGLESEIPTAPVEEIQSEEIEQSAQSDPSGIRIRLKYLDDTERTVRSNPTTLIGDFKRNHFSEDLANNKIVRLIFCGHLLRDNSTLESYRVVDNSVIHVQILQAQTDQNRSPVSQNADLDLSNLLWPLVSVILGICWIFYFKYPEFFNLLSIGLLLMFTSGFVVFCSMRQ